MRLFTANQLKKRTASPRGGCEKKAFSEAFISSEYKEETGRERPEARTCKKTVRKLICIMLTLPLMTAAAGCASKPKLESRFIQTNHTISPNSQWFASFIHQGIDSSLQVQAKDDFFTFANRNWLLNTQIAKADQQTGTVADGQKQVDQKIESIVRGQVEVNGGTRPAGLSEEQAEHDRDLVTKLAALAGNWDQRNKMGAEPLRPYLEAIENITTLEDLDHYLTSRDVKKIGPFSLMSVSVDPTVMDKTTNAVCLKRPNDQQSAALCRLTLPGYSNYMSMARMDLKAVTKARQAMRSVLGRLGYTADDIEKRVAQAFDLETELAEIYRNAEDFSILGDQERQKATENGFTLDELKDLAGRYPLAEFLEACGMGSTDRYNVDFPEAVPMIGRLYSPANLEKLKSYLILQTVLQAASLLDRDLYDTAAVLADPTDHDTPVNESNWDDETNILISGFIDKYLADPLNQVFIWQNCTEENKAMVRSLAEEIRDEYKDMLAREDWLSEETRQKAIEKLDCMAIRSLYPDTFADYTGLSLDKADNVVDAVAAIQNFGMDREAKRAGTPANLSEWPSSGLATSEVNAFYSLKENSINILEGYLISVWQPDLSREDILAKIGMVVGHEISHGFDTNGSKYDKNGLPENWWTETDRKAFEKRADTLAACFDTLVPLPGQENCDGQLVKDEAIADLGGLRCVLNIASHTPDFDYAKFFESYADLWKTKGTYELMNGNLQDSHPLNYLRVNAMVQQTPEFHDTYGVKENDGMYLAPEKRAAVW